MTSQQISNWFGHIAGAPATAYFRNDARTAANHGTVLIYHGFRAGREVQVREASLLAQNGFLAICLDNAGHGERRLPDFEKRFENPDTWRREFLGLVGATVSEVPRILDVLEQRGWCPYGRAGILGISMGGHIAYGAMLEDTRVRAITPLVSSPEWVCPQARYGEFYPRAILSQVAGKDEILSPETVVRFHQNLKALYPDQCHRLEDIVYHESNHMMRAEDWESALSRAVAWFETHLVRDPA